MKSLAFVLFALVLLTFGAVGVVAQDVRYDFDKDQDFSKYKTYKWGDRMDITVECRRPQHTDQHLPFTSDSSTSACMTPPRRNLYGVVLQRKR
jgi:hypothetical protein